MNSERRTEWAQVPTQAGQSVNSFSAPGALDVRIMMLQQYGNHHPSPIFYCLSSLTNQGAYTDSHNKESSLGWSNKCTLPTSGVHSSRYPFYFTPLWCSHMTTVTQTRCICCHSGGSPLDSDNITRSQWMVSSPCYLTAAQDQSNVHTDHSRPSSCFYFPARYFITRLQVCVC